ncbi:Os07g0494200 [Oryza sativa Japonica Group]|uniref:Os07g0494200 protein n=2 Tax=Oryza sativa subsp. japonica TaxID=39947 RepID=A3BJY9_ORYSJ|nr:hypothetical protein OsJ_24316 [Oryza sativa Japonica Group]BAT01581.1 Os07g0494200 [Oryza sativa Japonica Group]
MADIRKNVATDCLGRQPSRRWRGPVSVHSCSRSHPHVARRIRRRNQGHPSAPQAPPLSSTPTVRAAASGVGGAGDSRERKGSSGGALLGRPHGPARSPRGDSADR